MASIQARINKARKTIERKKKLKELKALQARARRM
jgi:hypothetical protein